MCLLHQDGGVQLQRIISRCRCQFFYAWYGDVEDEALGEVTMPVCHSAILAVACISLIITHVVVDTVSSSICYE